MQKVSTFCFQQNNIRVFQINDQIWFCADDVVKSLNLKNTTMALKPLDNDERSKLNLGRSKTTGGGGEVNIINESGLYCLIMRSRDAVKQGTVQHSFRKWVTSEVLPSIRKTGSYSLTINTQQQHTIKEAVHQNVSRTGRTFQAVYHNLYNRFQIPKYQDLLAKDFEAAIEYLGTPILKQVKDIVQMPFYLMDNADYMVIVRNGKITRRSLSYAEDVKDMGKPWNTLTFNR